MASKVTVRTELTINYSTDGRRHAARPPVEVSWSIGGQTQQGDLSGQSSLLLAVPTTDARLFLMMLATGATTMSILWNGLDAVPVPALFITTDNGYEVSDDGIVTPLAITNPTAGVYRFWLGEAPADHNVYPGGVDLSTITLPDSELP